MTDTIEIRIRVAVTASGEWAAVGGSDAVRSGWTYGSDIIAKDDLLEHGEPVAWHWVTARVPRPVVVDTEVAGEVTP